LEHSHNIADNHNHNHHDSHHDEGHKHNYKNVERKRLAATIILTAVVMVVEVIGGILSHSLALLSDSGHMFTHAFALLVSYFAILFASRKATTEKSFGFYRIEILAALFNGIFLIAVSAFIFWEAARRILNPKPVNVIEMLIISVIGLAANVVSAFILSGASKKSINVRSAFLHMVGDTLSSVAIIIGAIIIYYTGFYMIDAIFSIIICVAILYWAIILIRDSLHILMETTPKGINVKKMEDELIAGVREIKEIHDIHIWQITDSIFNMTAHVVLEDMHIKETESILMDINSILLEKYSIGHSVIQFEAYGREHDISTYGDHTGSCSHSH
jgi:cobalt-zinc-cadmium efflux system protein